MLQLNHKSEVTNAQGFDEIVKRIFRGNTIEQNGEFINLTDMWRASGLDESKKPVQFFRFVGADLIGDSKGVNSHFYTRK